MADVVLSKRGRLLFILPIVLVALSMFTGEPFVVVTAAFLFSIIFYSRFEVLNSSVVIEDHISDQNKTVGETFEVEHVVKGDRVLEVDLSKELADDFELTEDKKEIDQLSTGSHISYRVRPSSRGYHNIGKLKGWLYDPLKIYKKSIEHDIEGEVVVQSSKEAIKKAKTYSKRSYSQEFISDPFAFSTRSNEFDGIREFQPGDSMRDIHWKSFSKFQKLMTKIYETISPKGIHVILDCSPSMRRKLPDGSTKLDHSLYVTLQVLKNFQTHGHEIGMTAHDHTGIIFHQDLDLGEAAFRRIYEKVSDLPGAIESKDTSIERYDTSIDFDELDEKEERFSEKISQFSSNSRGKHLSGVLSAVDKIKVRGKEKRSVIMISDLESRPQAMLKAVKHLKEIDDDVWLINPFSPWYEVGEVDQEVLEKAYQEYEKLQNILEKLERLGCSIFELYPDREGIDILEERGEKLT